MRFALPLLLLLAACADAPSVPAAGAGDPDAHASAAAQTPAFVLDGPDGTLSSADALGRTLVLLFADAGDEAWQYLAQATPDLLAAGALVAGAATDGPAPEGAPFKVYDDPRAQAARRFGYTGAPLAVVIGPDGALRAHSVALRSAADFFAAAAPSLLDAEDDGPAAPVAGGAVDAAQVRQLVREGAALLDLRPAELLRVEGAIAHAVRAETPLAAKALPANLAVPVVIVGPGAAQAAARAQSWGYGHVYYLAETADLADPSEGPLVYPAQKNGHDAGRAAGPPAPGRVRS